MSCSFSRNALALHVEGDLADAVADTASQHLGRCEECRAFFEQLQDSQSLVKSLRRETVSSSECAGMRRDVMSILGRRDRLAWTIWVERVMTLALRRHAYAIASSAIVAAVSVSMLPSMRQAPVPGAKWPAVVFEGSHTLRRPDDYRGWVLISEPADERLAGDAGPRTGRTPTHRVYIDPEGYRAYAMTGTFAEGTVMIRESARAESDAAPHPHPRSPALLASVKDSSRFDGGWGFFDFTEPRGGTSSKAVPSPESSGCRTCHLREAETDSVFTQFYSALQVRRQGRQRDEMSRSSVTLIDTFGPARAQPMLSRS